jgi:hypothetical protein
MKLLIVFASLWTQLCLAADFKMRAREHFDIHQIDLGETSETYTGLSNTINFWWEEPFEMSYGFSANPVIGDASQKDSPLQALGERVVLVHLGAELKYFIAGGMFTRVGAGWTQLRTSADLKESNGYHGYSGFGWEFKAGKTGISIEAAYRYSQLQNKIAVLSFTPSVGFHFYEMF